MATKQAPVILDSNFLWCGRGHLRHRRQMANPCQLALTDSRIFALETGPKIKKPWKNPQTSTETFVRKGPCAEWNLIAETSKRKVWASKVPWLAKNKNNFCKQNKLHYFTNMFCGEFKIWTWRTFNQRGSYDWIGMFLLKQWNSHLMPSEESKYPLVSLSFRASFQSQIATCFSCFFSLTNPLVLPVSGATEFFTYVYFFSSFK